MKKEFIKQVLTNHNYPNTSQKSYFDKDIEIVVNQSNTKIKLHAFNHKTGRFLNLSAKKYSALINSFKDISSDFYSSSNYYYITLNNSNTKNINKENNILSSKIYGYARVSTKSQEDNTSLNNQIQILKENGCIEVFHEICSGGTMERTEFINLESKLKKGDTIIITKLDRFTRSTEKGISKIKELAHKGVKVNILNMGIVDLSSAVGKMIFTILSSFAEYEKDCIVERMKEGKAIAKLDSNFKEGRPRKYKKEQIQLALELLETHTYKQVEAKTGISKSTLIRAKKNQNFV